MKKKLYYEPMLAGGKTIWIAYGSRSSTSAMMPITLYPEEVEEQFPSNEWEYIAIKNDEFPEEESE